MMIMASHEEQTVCSGIGLVSAAGDYPGEFVDSLYRAASVRRDIPPTRLKLDLDAVGVRTRSACWVLDDPQPLIHSDRYLFPTILHRMIETAREDAGLASFPPQTCLLVSTSVGAGFGLIAEVTGGEDRHEVEPSSSAGMIASIRDKAGIERVAIISNACAGGADAIGRADMLLQAGRYDCVIACGIDYFTEITFSGFNALQALSRHACRPFDRRRDGLVLGDGAAAMVLERRSSARDRGARLHGSILSHSSANEAFHPTGPDPTGDTAARVMRDAIDRAGLSPDDIHHINAHGTGTRANDEAELRAIRSAFGKGSKAIPITSLKAQLGHTLGAAGLLEAAAALLYSNQGFIPPTLNLEDPDDHGSCEFVITASMDLSPTNIISNSFGFGGCVSSVVLQASHLGE